MHRFRATLLMFLTLGLLLNGCALPGQAQPTQAPIIIIASPLPQGNPPTRRTAADRRQASAQPTQAAAADPGRQRAGADCAGRQRQQGHGHVRVRCVRDLLPRHYHRCQRAAPSARLRSEAGAVRPRRRRRHPKRSAGPSSRAASGMCWRPRWMALRAQSDPSIGAITAVIDESAGADKLVAKPEIATINDLKGKKIAFSQGSVGEYFLYYALSLAGLGPQDVTLAAAAGGGRRREGLHRWTGRRRLGLGAGCARRRGQGRESGDRIRQAARDPGCADHARARRLITRPRPFRPSTMPGSRRSRSWSIRPIRPSRRSSNGATPTGHLSRSRAT